MIAILKIYFESYEMILVPVVGDYRAALIRKPVVFSGLSMRKVLLYTQVVHRL